MEVNTYSSKVVLYHPDESQFRVKSRAFASIDHKN